jgi:hypothetical protein
MLLVVWEGVAVRLFPIPMAAANLFSLFLTAYFQLLIFKDLMLFEYYIF